MPYTIYPWIISNDRIKELGWEAQHTNEEAYVVGYEPKLSDQLNAWKPSTLSVYRCRNNRWIRYFRNSTNISRTQVGPKNTWSPNNRVVR